MKYISLFSGIEAASVAWGPFGWEPVAFSEIEPFPKAVLKHRYPNVPDLGDITKIDWSPYADSADVVVGGSPCQSFSVAGNRTGLAGASGLMWEYVRAVRAIRPQWFIWENVPGALSSSHGEDFRCLLESMDDLGYGLAWRVLDAQFFGVAQRRRRVFLVGHLGDQRAAEVLFESEGMSWDYPSSREKRKALTRRPESSARTAGGDCLTPWDHQSKKVYRTDGVCPTLNAQDRKAVMDGRGVLTAAFSAGQSSLAGSIAYREELSPTLRAGASGTNQVPSVVVFAQNQRDEVRDLHDCAGALAAQPGVKQQTFVYCATDSDPNAAVEQNLALMLTAHDAKSTSYVSVPSTLQIRSGKAGGGKGALVAENMSATLTTGVQQTLFPGNGTVRRLTPVECERLQGFEDGYTDVPYRGKQHSPDSARYKALGNSMCTHVMQWIGEGIRKAQEGCDE